MRRTLLALLLSAACARTEDWPSSQRTAYMALCGVIAGGADAPDRDNCCRRAYPAVARNFPSYGAWRVAIEDAELDRDFGKIGIDFAVSVSRSAPLQNWYVELRDCGVSK